MNKAMLVGRLTADPELRHTGNGTPVCNFTLAINRRHADAQGNRQADYLPVIAWRQMAESCHKYLSKGKMAGVVGEIQTRSYSAQDGSKRYVTEIVADAVEFLTPRSAGGNAAGADGVPEGFEEVEDDELPF